jgi:ring-1,2-phenylacetyl-CoA epoxidase subunit PaaA
MEHIAAAPKEEMLLAKFEATVERCDAIEPRDWMPEGYRKHLIRQISRQADLAGQNTG